MKRLMRVYSYQTRNQKRCKPVVQKSYGTVNKMRKYQPKSQPLQTVQTLQPGSLVIYVLQLH